MILKIGQIHIDADAIVAVGAPQVQDGKAVFVPVHLYGGNVVRIDCKGKTDAEKVHKAILGQWIEGRGRQFVDIT